MNISILTLINTQAFQGLKFISQLGLVNYVFPNAKHNRFSHSLGTLYTIDRICRQLRKKGIINETEEQDSVKGCVCVKIRTDFVTNSSSSSFIVSFDKIPETVEELQKMMFYDYETWDFSGIECSTEEIASVVFQDLQNQIESGQKLSDEDLWFFDEDEGNEVKKELEDSNTFHFHYSDNISDLETVMEHGDIFWNLKHRRILRR